MARVTKTVLVVTTTILLIILFLFLPFLCHSQEEFKISTYDSVGNEKVLMRVINKKDTTIYDTIGLVRYLLKDNDIMYDSNRYLREQFYKSMQLLDIINGIMFVLPKKKEEGRL